MSPSPSPAALPSGQTTVAPFPGFSAPELEAIHAWINTGPLTLSDLRGKVVLVDFWTYTCINCIRTLPYLTDWHAKYADSGLVIVGVHSPEFSFEQKLENVQSAVAKYDIRYPVALDNDFRTWRAYQNRYWPHKFLIDKNGVIRYHHIGEGEYATTEMWIQRLLKEVSPALPQTPIVERDRPVPRELLMRMTPELYAGSERGIIGNGLGLYGKEDVVFTDTAYHDEDTIYLRGSWFIDKEEARHTRVAKDFEDYVLLRYSARSVNLVINSQAQEPFRVRVTLDGAPLDESNKGADVFIADDGYSYIEVRENRLYNLVDAPDFRGRELQVAVESDAFAFYAFTFGP